MSPVAKSSELPSPDQGAPAGFHRHGRGPDFRVMCAHIGRRYVRDAPLLKKAWLVLGSGVVQKAMAKVKPGETFKATSIVQHYAAAIEDATLAEVSGGELNTSDPISTVQSSAVQPESIQHFFDGLASRMEEDGVNRVRVESKYFGVNVEISATVAEIHNSLVVLSVPKGRAKVLTKCTVATLHFDHCDTAFIGELAAVDLDTNLIYIEKLAMSASGNRAIKAARASENPPIEARVTGKDFEFTGRLENITIDSMTIFFGHAEKAKLTAENKIKISVFLQNYDDENFTEIAASTPIVKSVEPALDDSGLLMDVEIDTDEELLNNLFVWLGRRNPLS